MRNRLLRAAIAFLGAGAGMAQPSGARADFEPTSMRFEWITEGPAETCATRCREWIAASGPITADTPRDFDTFSQMRDLGGATLVLDSGGGAVLPSLDLGRKIRRFAMTTTVGRTLRLPGLPAQAQRARLSPRGECASMCAFVLLGGTQRRVPAEARILVHQIWPGTKRYDAGAESYTAEEIMRIQRDAGQIARYTVEMGADIELFDLAMRIPPWERLRALSPAELRRIGFQPAEVPSEAATSGAASGAGADRASGGAALSERGWTLVDGTAGRLAVSRRHALTIEGEEIGAFELWLECPQAGGDYRVAYRERRRLGASDASEPRLAIVNLFVGREPTPLAIESSASDPARAELGSAASGLVSAEVVEQLRATAHATLGIRTLTTEGEATSMRFGATGLAAAFPRFLAGCRAEVAALQ